MCLNSLFKFNPSLIQSASFREKWVNNQCLSGVESQWRISVPQGTPNYSMDNPFDVPEDVLPGNVATANSRTSIGRLENAMHHKEIALSSASAEIDRLTSISRNLTLQNQNMSRCINKGEKQLEDYQRTIDVLTHTLSERDNLLARKNQDIKNLNDANKSLDVELKKALAKIEPITERKNKYRNKVNELNSTLKIRCERINFLANKCNSRRKTMKDLGEQRKLDIQVIKDLKAQLKKAKRK